MGSFGIATLCPHGRLHRQVTPNHLMWRAQGHLLRKAFPSSSGGPWTFSIGFAGPMLQSRYQRPMDWDLCSSLFDRSGGWSDYVGGYCSLEGASLSDAMRALLGYERQSVDFSAEGGMVEDSKGISIDTGWKQFTNTLQWNRYGDWEPYDWRDDKGEEAVFPQPPKYYNWNSKMPDLGFPWNKPRVYRLGNTGYWYNSLPPYYCVLDGVWDYDKTEEQCGTAGGTWTQKEHPDNQNYVDESCSECATLFHLEHVGEVRVGCSFVTIEASGVSEILAASVFAEPICWRPGAIISVRYMGRFS